MMCFNHAIILIFTAKICFHRFVLTLGFKFVVKHSRKAQVGHLTIFVKEQCRQRNRLYTFLFVRDVFQNPNEHWLFKVNIHLLDSSNAHNAKLLLTESPEVYSKSQLMQ